MTPFADKRSAKGYEVCVLYAFLSIILITADQLFKVMTVNEIGNVALVTNEFTDMMILVMK